MVKQQGNGNGGSWLRCHLVVCNAVQEPLQRCLAGRVLVWVVPLHQLRRRHALAVDGGGDVGGGVLDRARGLGEPRVTACVHEGRDASC